MEENQTFNTLDSISVWGLLVGVFAVISMILASAMADDKSIRARSRSEQLAVQILSGGYKNLSQFQRSMPKRGLASVEKLNLQVEGHIGADPWGNPYHYTVLKNDANRTLVLVYSYGANRQRDTLEGLKVLGDDIGSLVTEN